MGCMLKGWLCVKGADLLAYILEQNYENQLKQANKDLNLLGKDLAAFPFLAEKSLRCSISTLIYMDQVNLANAHLFDLPPSTQMTPLGSGTSFRFGEALKDLHVQGISLERVLLKNDDVLNVDDALATQLTNVFVSEHEGEIGNPSFDLPAALRATIRGNFHALFEKSIKEERRGTARYHVDPLLLYGHYHTIGERRPFMGKVFGYDLKSPPDSDKNIFTQLSPVKTEGQVAFFEMVTAIQKLHHELYMDRVNVSPSNLSLLTLLRRSGEIFLLADYINPSQRAPPKFDHFGVLLGMTRDAKGATFAKVMYQLSVLLASYLDKFRQGSSIGDFLSIGNKLRVL